MPAPRRTRLILRAADLDETTRDAPSMGEPDVATEECPADHGRKGLIIDGPFAETREQLGG
jgi:hypothetical protein